MPGFNSNEVLLKAIEKLKEFLHVDNMQINQPIILADAYTELASLMGVQSIVKLELYNLSNSEEGYSGNVYDIENATRSGVVYPSLDPSIFELKYPNIDIKGRITTY